ncbi:outer membrane scaffolding protein for murein synthesis (MipA/OmpV family) [Sphingomonas insulae]|uniref:MipA/OmpV family protein n=2 Tax=Sphingomonas insulae TaxID=424800 RepID=A0ABP3SQ91_9SPHN|nr:outer membrane scaffolding protein for murein synthesis (MipA/OmpV family) [Sphingomonas insulae]
MSAKILMPLALAAAATFAAPALAQDVQGLPPSTGSVASTAAEFDLDRDSVTIGAAGVYLTDYEGSNDYRWTPAPAAIGSIKGFSFTLAGNRLSVDLIPNQPGPTWDLQAGPIGVVNFNRNSLKNIDDPRVRALGKVDTAIELGGYVGIGKTGVITSPYDKLSVTVSYRHDVANAHDSGIWQPSVNYITPLSPKAAVALFGSAERAGRGYATTYFSVSPTQTVASGLPTYNARGGWKNYTLGGLATYSITGNLLKGFKIVAGGTYRRMLNDFADSPLVSIAGSKNQWLGAVGLAYTF